MKQKSQKGLAREQLFFYQIIGALEWQKQRRVYISVRTVGMKRSKWLGQCPMCKEWNTFAEEKVVSIKGQKSSGEKQVQAVTLSSVTTDEDERMKTELVELDRGAWWRNCARITGPGWRRSRNW